MLLSWLLPSPKSPARSRKSPKLTLETLEDRSVPSAAMLKDINTVTGDAMPIAGQTAEYHDRLYFFASDGTHGTELWSTDGTAAGTAMVKDVNAGPASAAWQNVVPPSLAVAGDKLLFTANDGANQRELWATDGTTAGTHMVKAFRPQQQIGPPDAPQNLTGIVAFNGKAYFSADDGTHGTELWGSDGTAAGTALVMDVNATPAAAGGTNSSLAASPTVAGGKLFFSAGDGLHGNELWVTDGVAAPHLVKDIAPDNPSTPGTHPSSYPSALHAVGNKLFFVASQSAYVTDGTAAGTTTLPTTTFADVENFATVGTTLYFTTTSFASPGMTVWKTDGTAGGTGVVLSIGGWVSGLASANGKLFALTTAGIGMQLQVSDGTAAGTATIHTFSSGQAVNYLRGLGGAVYLSTGQELWRSDGTAAGTVRVKVFNTSPLLANAPGPIALARFHAKDYVVANDVAHGQELWQTDGTAAGTVMLKDINPVTADSSPREAVTVGGMLYFLADAGNHPLESSYGGALWKTDGTAAGTVLVKDLRAPGSAGSSPPASGLTNFGGTLYFIGNDGTHGSQLWKSDGTAAGTLAVTHAADGKFAEGLIAAGGAMYFIKSDGGTSELWKSDGTESGTTLVHAFRAGTFVIENNFTALNGKVFFDVYAGDVALWQTDGTDAGTIPVTTAAGGAGVPPAVPYFGHVVMGGKLYFLGDDNGVRGRELWATDGTAVGTRLVARAWSGTGSAAAAGGRPGASYPKLIVSGGKLFFHADDGTSGDELWVSDGTAAGTRRVTNIHPDNAGPTGASIRSLADVGGVAYFTANDGVHGQELWKSDGTSAGTVMVKEIFPGPGPADPRPGFDGPFNLSSAGGRLYFVANDGSGMQLWSSDGTPAGTVPRTGLHASAASDPWGGFTQDFPLVTAVGDKLFFGADDGAHGNEPWVLSPDVPALQVQGTAFDATAGQAFNRNVATFSNPGGPTDASRYSATIDWGDGTSSAGSILGDGTLFRVAGTHTYAAAGLFTVRVAVRANGGPAVTGTATVTVHAPVAAGAGVYASGHFVRQTETRTFTAAVASFRPRNPAAGAAAAFTAAVDWGDGTTSAGAIRVNPAGGFDVVGTHTYARPGAYAIQVRIINGSVTTTAAASAKVDPVVMTALGLTATAPVTQATVLTLATFRDADRTATADLYSVLIDWADGSTSAGTVVSDGAGGFVVKGGHAYTHAGLYAATVTIRDATGHTARAAVSIRVTG